MAFLTARKTTWDALSSEDGIRIKSADPALALGDPAVFRPPSGNLRYVWEDPRIGDGESWVDAAPAGLFTVYLWGLPADWVPHSEGGS